METYMTTKWGEVSKEFLISKKKKIKTCGLFQKFSVIFLFLSLLCFGAVYFRLQNTFPALNVLDSQLLLIVFFVLAGLFLLNFFVWIILYAAFQIPACKKALKEASEQLQERREAQKTPEMDSAPVADQNKVFGISEINVPGTHVASEDYEEAVKDEAAFYVEEAFADSEEDSEDDGLIPESVEMELEQPEQPLKEDALLTPPAEAEEIEVNDLPEPDSKSEQEPEGAFLARNKDVSELVELNPASIRKIPEAYAKDIQNLAFSLNNLFCFMSDSEKRLQELETEKEKLIKENSSLKEAVSTERASRIAAEVAMKTATIQSSDDEVVIQLLPDVETIPIYLSAKNL